MENKIYDKQDVFTSKIKPLMSQLAEVCTKEEVPFFCCVATGNNKTQTQYETVALNPAAMGFRVADDRFVEHLKVQAGFEATTDDIPELDI